VKITATLIAAFCILLFIDISKEVSSLFILKSSSHHLCLPDLSFLKRDLTE